jgi:hypothetical protein
VAQLSQYKTIAKGVGVMKSIKAGLLTVAIASAGMAPNSAIAQSSSPSVLVPFATLCDATSRHHMELCQFLEAADEVLGYERAVSLTRDPNSYVVMARYGDDWSVYARGVHRLTSKNNEGSWTTETREITRRISPELAQRFTASLAWRGKLEETTAAAQLEEICLDGIVVTLAVKGSDFQSGGDPKTVVRQSVCGGDADIHAMRLDFEKLAIGQDPEMAKFFPQAVSNLSGLASAD